MPLGAHRTLSQVDASEDRAPLGYRVLVEDPTCLLRGSLVEREACHVTCEFHFVLSQTFE